MVGQYADIMQSTASFFYIDISVFSDMSARPRFVVSPYLPTTYVKKKCKIYYFFISGFLGFLSSIGVAIDDINSII